MHDILNKVAGLDGAVTFARAELADDVEHYTLVNDAIRQLAERNGVRLVDLDREMAPFDPLMRDDGIHWEPGGVNIKADAITATVRDIIAERWGAGASLQTGNKY